MGETKLEERGSCECVYHTEAQLKEKTMINVIANGMQCSAAIRNLAADRHAGKTPARDDVWVSFLAGATFL
jgi:hypothetical protein